MTKATRIINKYHIKEILLNGDPQFENFYKEELIQFCEVARELLKQNQKYKEVIDKAKDLLIIKKARCLNEDNYVLNVPDLDDILQVLEEVE